MGRGGAAGLASACGMACLVAIAAGVQFGPDVEKLRLSGSLAADPAIVWLEASGYPYALAACHSPRDKAPARDRRAATAQSGGAPATQDRWCLLPPLQ